MARMTNEQKQLVAFWVMLTTNNDIFEGTSPIPIGATQAELASKMRPVLDKLTAITAIDQIKLPMLAATMRPNTFGAFNAMRDLYQSFAQSSTIWPQVAGADHPPLIDLQDTLFPQQAADRAPVVEADADKK